MQKLKLSTLSFADLYAMKEAAKTNICVFIHLEDTEQLEYWTALFKACNAELELRVNDAMQPLPVEDIFISALGK